MTRSIARTLAVFPLALVTALSAHAQGRDRAALPAVIDSIAQSYLKDGRAAGMSLAVIKGRDTIALKGYGMADLELDVPTPARAVYEIGSVTKQFTAAAILALQEDGKLSLDDDLRKFLPDYPTQGYTVTLRRLLDHTSGIKGYTEIAAFGNIMTRSLPKDSLVALFKNEKFIFAPGDAEDYNNSAFFLLGLVIEKASGKSYAAYVKERLFDKAGMADSRYCSETAIIKRKVHGYDFSPVGLVNKGFVVHTYPYAAGSLCSTAGDLVAWNRALHGGRVLSPAMYQEMITPGTLNDGSPLRYAKGIAVHTIGGHRTIEHGGAINGFLSESAYFPEQDLVIIVLLNTAGPVSANAVTESLVEAVLGKPTRDARPLPASFATLAGKYAGNMRSSMLTVTVSASATGLSARLPRRPSDMPLRYIGNDTWEADDTRLTIRVAPTGTATLRLDNTYGSALLTRSGP